MLTEDFRRLTELLTGRRMVVLSGAGCSTESGIPDYRGPGSRPRTPSPVLYRDFVGDPAARTRYWSRSVIGWPKIDTARPNPGHHAVARLEGRDAVRGVITQNVDGLHQAAGSRRVIELHGTLSRVVCLGCGAPDARRSVQRRLRDANPDRASRPARLAPDGDAEVRADEDAREPAGAGGSFRVVGCRRCGGILKPDVVFFGENVPGERMDRAWALFEEAEALLVLGSSLTVHSGYRFVLHAAEDDVPVAVVNLESTRADELAAVRVRGRVGEVLPRLADALVGEDAAPDTSAARGSTDGSRWRRSGR